MTISRIREAVLNIEELVNQDGEIILLDYPFHLNFGDLLIWEGERKFFDNIGISLTAQYHMGQGDVRHLRRIIGDRTIILQGGGNFGTLYPAHQNFRRRIVQSFPNNRILLFPQTLSPDTSEALAPDIEVYGKHPEMILMWRDAESLKRAQDLFPNQSYLVPDMAFALDLNVVQSMMPSAKPRGLVLGRTDKEKRMADLPIPRDVRTDVSDWPHMAKAAGCAAAYRRLTLAMRPIRRAAKIVPGRDTAFELVTRWETQAFVRLSHACLSVAQSVLSEYDFVITDRLHGHILCTLLRIPHLVIDNSYGKNRNFYDSWTKDDECSVLYEGAESLSVFQGMVDRMRTKES